MQVTIVGAGAIGSLLAARIARSGCDVSLLVRGDSSLLPGQSRIQLIDDDGEHAVAVGIESEPTKLGLQDLIVLAVKAHAIVGALHQIAPLLGPQTTVLTAVNGVPWWFFAGHQPRTDLTSVDPDGQISEALERQQLVGCVLFPAAQIIAPGCVRHISGNRIVFGNPRPADNRAADVVDLFANAGFEAPVAPDIRAVIWAKLVGNAAINPLSVITGATIQHMAEQPNLSAILTSAMAEIDTVGLAIEIAPMMSQGERLQLASSVGHHKTSMLQDFEAGRTLELAPLLGAVREIARWKAVPTPILDTFDHLVAAKLAGSPVANKDAGFG